MPRGRPSSVSQISMTASAVCSSKMPKSGPDGGGPLHEQGHRVGGHASVEAPGATPARAPRRRPAGARATSRGPAGSRSERGSAPIAAAAAARTCSQLSTTRSRRRPATASATVSMTGVVALRRDAEGLRDRVRHGVRGRRPGPARPATPRRGTRRPARRRRPGRAGSCRRRRPRSGSPAGCVRTSAAIDESSSSRPTRVVGDLGRLPRPCLPAHAGQSGTDPRRP